MACEDVIDTIRVIDDIFIRLAEAAPQNWGIRLGLLPIDDAVEERPFLRLGLGDRRSARGLCREHRGGRDRLALPVGRLVVRGMARLCGLYEPWSRVSSIEG
jgi:hypothetical protein